MVMPICVDKMIISMKLMLIMDMDKVIPPFKLDQKIDVNTVFVFLATTNVLLVLILYQTVSLVAQDLKIHQIVVVQLILMNLEMNVCHVLNNV